jgi:phosphatidylinositol alpha-mannosyltransferase
MRIALVHAYTWPEVRRGGERMVDDLTTYLRGAGHTVDVYTGTRGESQFHRGHDGRNYKMRIPWLRALQPRGVSPIETFALRAMTPLVVHRYDAVHAFTPTAALAAIACAQRTVYTVIGHPTADTLPIHRVQRTALRRAVAHAAEVCVLSRSAGRSALEAFGRTAHVLPPGVYLDRYEPNLIARTGPPRLLFSADLSNPDKGLPVLFAAFDRVLGSHPGARLALSGPGSPDAAIAAAGEVWPRIQASVDVLGTGSVEDVPERYRGAHVTVLPSSREAFGIVLVESLAAGTPVIGGRPGGAEDIIAPEAGRLVDIGDANALATAITDCAAMSAAPQTAERCTAHARSWDWSVIGPRYEELYAAVRRGGRARRSAARPSPS